MIETDLSLNATKRDSQIIRAVERAAAAEGLIQTLKGTLVKYPGCIHWHYKKGKQPGTLEITWFPRERRLWFKIAHNRNNAWIDEAVPRLRRAIESNM
jgi:hypothetical protein